MWPMVVWLRPSISLARTTSPASKAFRTSVVDTTAPSSKTGATSRTVKPCFAPSSRNVSTVPAPPAPNLNPRPTMTALALSPSTRYRVTNVSADSPASSASNSSESTPSTPASSSRYALWFGPITGSGTFDGLRTALGWFAKLSTTGASMPSSATSSSSAKRD